jgi:hypothetical protein
VLRKNKCFKLIQGYRTYNTVIFTKHRMCYGIQKWTLPRSGFYIPASGKCHKALRIHSLALVSATAQPNRTSYSQMQCLYSVTKFNIFSRCYKNFRIQYTKFRGLWANFKTKTSQLLFYSIHILEAANSVWQELEWALTAAPPVVRNHSVK